MNSKETEKDLYSSPNPIRQILYSRKPLIVLLKYTLLFTVAIIGFFNLCAAVSSLIPPSVYKKDFIQEYLLVRAVSNGLDPYLPLPELSQRFIGSLPNLVFQHPTPHPPPVILLCLPLAMLSYEQAAVAWFLFEIICIVLSTYLILFWLGKKPGIIFTVFISGLPTSSCNH